MEIGLGRGIPVETFSALFVYTELRYIGNIKSDLGSVDN